MRKYIFNNFISGTETTTKSFQFFFFILRTLHRLILRTSRRLRRSPTTHSFTLHRAINSSTQLLLFHIAAKFHVRIHLLSFFLFFFLFYSHIILFNIHAINLVWTSNCSFSAEITSLNVICKTYICILFVNVVSFFSREAAAELWVLTVFAFWISTVISFANFFWWLFGRSRNLIIER